LSLELLLSALTCASNTTVSLRKVHKAQGNRILPGAGMRDYAAAG